jgi:hypothetical protein
VPITKTILPSSSLLNNPALAYDYVDSFQGEVMDPDHKLTVTDVGKAFFSSSPKWVGTLFTLRNIIVALLGLKTPDKISNREQKLANFKCEPGEKLGLFKVFSKSDNEVILGEDDKHLNFRVSLLLDHNTIDPTKKTLIVSTTVVFNNWFGRMYFMPVRPFHRLIVPSMMGGIIRELEGKRSSLLLVS